MRFKIYILTFLLSMGSLMAQEKLTKADEYFFAYAYDQAISEYQKQMSKGKLMTNQQFLNLADAYFNTGDYGKAVKIYLDINKSDTLMTNHQFNKMLQGLSKTAEHDRVKAFLRSRSQSLSGELVENANFNYELLDSGEENESVFEIFNVNGNSAQSDFSPTFYKDKLLFSSGRPKEDKKIYGPSGESYLDIYLARLGTYGDVLNPNPFTRMPGSKYHKSTPYYSEPLGRIFYILSNTEDGQMSFDANGKNALAIGTVDDDGTFRFLLRDLSTSFYYPFFQESTGRLFFSANFEDSYGGTDLYYVNTNNGQIMSAPVNLGPRINSPANEIAPYIFENSLYFSSDIFYGLGGMDIYKSNIQDNDTYGIPINLGSGMNSTADDFGFIIKEKAKGELVGYFASNRKGGKGGDDIYGFSITGGTPGLKTFALRGTVINLNSKNGIAKAQIHLLDKDGQIIKEIFANENGDYSFEIPWQNQVTIQATKERYSVFSVTFSEEDMEDVQQAPLNMGIAFIDDLIEKKEDKIVFKLKKFYFEKGRSKITKEISTELDKVVDAVSRFPQLQLKIESHTDSRGGSSTNKRLSQNRSDAIKAYLLKNGLSSSNIQSSQGYGEEQIVNNCTNGVYCLDFLHKQNERTLIVVSNYNELGE